MSSHLVKTLTFLALWLFTTTSFASSPSYGVYGLHTTGSTRLLGMGGAFVGLADDASAVLLNPAGVSMSRWSFDMQSSTNRVINREGDINFDGNPDGIPYIFNYVTAGINFGRLGLGLGYTTPFQLHHSLPGGATKYSAKIESLDVSLSFLMWKNLSLGFTLHSETATMGASSAALPLLEDSDSQLSTTFGVLFRPDNRWKFGITYRAGREYKINSNLNAEIQNEFGSWFQNMSIADKLSMGFSFKLNQNLILVGDIDHYSKQQNVFLIGSDINNSSQELLHKNHIIWHGGFEFFVLNKKNIEFIWRGGGYQEPSRLNYTEPRLHFTMGVELRMGPLRLSSAYDQAKNFTNYSQSIGISLVDLK